MRKKYVIPAALALASGALLLSLASCKSTAQTAGRAAVGTTVQGARTSAQATAAGARAAGGAAVSGAQRVIGSDQAE